MVRSAAKRLLIPLCTARPRLLPSIDILHELSHFLHQLPVTGSRRRGTAGLPRKAYVLTRRHDGACTFSSRSVCAVRGSAGRSARLTAGWQDEAAALACGITKRTTTGQAGIRLQGLTVEQAASSGEDHATPAECEAAFPLFICTHQ